GNAVWVPFEADVLTSQPIRLDSVFSPVAKVLKPADSVYFSFYYQPQGYGNAPEDWDSLVLEFSSRGPIEFQYMDSTLVHGYDYLASDQDTIKPGDTLYAPVGCNPEVRTVVYEYLTYDDAFMVACDSVFGPSTNWNKVWYANGMRLDTFQLKNGGKSFVQVMIPITDTIYFYDKFTFRFRNYASIANDIIPSWRSNCDEWNVDFVYLNYNRSESDTTYQMLTFSDRAPSFLKNYQVMPYRQYRADAAINTMRLDFPMYISNLDKIEHNTKYEYTVQQVNGNFGYTYNGGNCNLSPYYENGFQNCEACQKHACPAVQSAFNFDYTRDTTSYIIKHYISDSSESNILVDSAIYTQGFYNYYAYDDGTPEFGYGLEPAGAQLAYQFKLSVPDTLWGVQMYFNQVVEQANVNYFNLVVWRDNNGRPGEIAYTLPSQKPKWTNEGIYHFYTYEFEIPIILSGTFYVGWQQLSFGSLNLGLDANNNNQNRIFYKIEQNWINSGFPGSLLIRPIVGQNMILGTSEIEFEQMPPNLKLFPNPASTQFSFDKKVFGNNATANVFIYSVYGSLVIQQEVSSPSVNISNLSPGLYVVKISSDNKIFTGKLIIQH
ncbi:MAG TPA: T9SS type A sorting domain-containing protein, partial [Bacteroidales bacterium]